MRGIYLIILLFILVLSIIYKINDIKSIKIFGFELSFILLSTLLLTFLLGEFILPIPQYYIKHQPSDTSMTKEENSLNNILEEEALKSGIDFDSGSFEINDSYGTHFNHLFLCSYEINGLEEVRLFHFEKNIFGNMKPKHSLNDAFIITKEDNDFYQTYMEDSILGGYLVTAGFASESTILKNYQLNQFRMGQLHPTSYFLWVELVREPWKSELVKFMLLFLLLLFINRNRDYRKPIKFYCKWRKGDRIFQCIRKDEN